MRHVRATGDAHTRQTDDIQWWAQLVDPVAESPAIKRQRTERASAACCTDRFVHVRQGTAGIELHSSVLLEKRDHLRSLLQIHALTLVQGVGVQLFAQITLRCVVVLNVAFGYCEWITRNP